MHALPAFTGIITRRTPLAENFNCQYFFFEQGLSNSIIDRDEKAREATKEYLKRSPNASIEKLKSGQGYKDPARVKFWLDAYRKAGIPEK